MNSLNISLGDFPNLFSGGTEYVLASLGLQPDERRVLEEICARNGNNEAFEYIYVALNELRHEYAFIDELRSFGYVNRILSRFPMDDYTINILTEWNLGKDDRTAVRWLLTYAERYPQYFHVRATCLLRAAQLFEEHGDRKEALQIYRAFVTLKEIETSHYFDKVKEIYVRYPELISTPNFWQRSWLRRKLLKQK